MKRGLKLKKLFPWGLMFRNVSPNYVYLINLPYESYLFSGVTTWFSPSLKIFWFNKRKELVDYKFVKTMRFSKPKKSAKYIFEFSPSIDEKEALLFIRRNCFK